MFVCFFCREKCGEKSLRVLEELVRRQGFNYQCRDDPEELILIMCSEQWEAHECDIARQVLKQTWHKKLYGTSNGNQNSLVFIVLSLSFLFRVTLS